MIRVLLSAPLCLHIRLSSRFPCWPEMWIVPHAARFRVSLAASSLFVQSDGLRHPGGVSLT
jgi:hypothetical protein